MAVELDTGVGSTEPGKDRLERYAELAVRVGANVEEGQNVFVRFTKDVTFIHKVKLL